MSPAVVIAVGAVLCFAGALSLRLAVVTAGFGLSWLLADAFGAAFVTGLLVGVAGAVVALVLTVVLSHVAMFFTGALVGAVLGAKLFVVLGGSDPSPLLAVVFVPAVAFVCGFLASRYQRAFLRWVTAFAGAALVLSGLGRLDEDDIGLLYRPSSTTETVLMTAAWLILGAVGYAVQGVLTRGRARD